MFFFQNYSQHGREDRPKLQQGCKRPSIQNTLGNEGSASKIPKKVGENTEARNTIIKQEPGGANGGGFQNNNSDQNKK